MTRVYQAVALSVGSTLVLDEAASHHLSRVLRAGVDETITLFNGEGGEYQAKITHIAKKNVTVLIQSFSDREVESPLHLTLAQGMARGEKMDFIIQKACELGVNVIQPLITSRCNVKLEGEREEKRLLHWQAVIQSACEQSGRNRLPRIAAPISISQWLTKVDAELKLVLTPWSEQSVNLRELKNIKSAVLLIGPEGGLSEDEVGMAERHQFKALKLGARVLRTETATVVGLSLVQIALGDLLHG
jgi:16S rRNA (uracil1498-N3)-methyltransferase